jgi:hypothetical protein
MTVRPVLTTRCRCAWTALCLAGTISALLLAFPAEPNARSRPHTPRLVSPRANYLATDGDRYVAYGKRSENRMTVVDTRTRRATSVQLPADCSMPSGTPQRRMAAGVALLTCGSSEQSARLIDLRTGTVTVPPSDWSTEGATKPVIYQLLGRNWLQGDTTCANQTCEAYLNWRTGERRLLPSLKPIDLDSPVFRELRACAPYRHVTLDSSLLQYRSPYLVFLSLGDGPQRLLLGRCGRRSQTLDSSGRVEGTSAQLSGGLVTWDDTIGRNVVTHALDLKSRAKSSWTIPGSNRRRDGFSLHTRYAVYLASAITVSPKPDVPTTVRVYAVRLRR